AGTGKGGNPGDGGVARAGTKEPGTRSNDPPNDPGADAPPKVGPGDPALASKAGELQLDEFKKKVTKDLLKDLKWTEQDYQQFLKAYEQKLKQDRQRPLVKENLGGAQKPGLLPNQAPRKLGHGTPGTGGPLETGQALPPPEFREAQRNFTSEAVPP